MTQHGFTDDDILFLKDIMVEATVYAEEVIDLIKKQKIESFALQLGSIHNALRKAAFDAKNIVDRVEYLGK